jgi:hypothetical protein
MNVLSFVVEAVVEFFEDLEDWWGEGIEVDAVTDV